MSIALTYGFMLIYSRELKIYFYTTSRQTGDDYRGHHRG